MNSPSDELMKDLFAQFGITYYHSEVLCAGLGIFYALMSFKNTSDITKSRLEEKLAEANYLTLGQIIDKVKPLISIDLQKRLDEALEKRNYFAHQLWYEQAYAIFTESGSLTVIDELRWGRQMFEELDDEFERLTIKRCKEIGVTDETIETFLQRGLAGEVEPLLPSKPRLSRNMIRIVRAYDIILENGGLAQVLETDSGQFLQFCDVGLGWSNFTEVKSNWKVNEVLSQYLPASIVPRPEITDPWNYEFKLPQNAVLWVKRGNAEKTFRWGIRKAKK